LRRIRKNSPAIPKTNYPPPRRNAPWRTFKQTAARQGRGTRTLFWGDRAAGEPAESHGWRKATCDARPEGREAGCGAQNKFRESPCANRLATYFKWFRHWGRVRRTSLEWFLLFSRAILEQTLSWGTFQGFGFYFLGTTVNTAKYFPHAPEIMVTPAMECLSGTILNWISKRVFSRSIS
jgi:hypothetical protein